MEENNAMDCKYEAIGVRERERPFIGVHRGAVYRARERFESSFNSVKNIDTDIPVSFEKLEI